MRKLANWLDSYLEYTENSEPPKLFHIWTAISTMAAVLQRKCVIKWGHIRFFPNMYIVLCGPPGKVRKGTAMSYGMDFLKRLDIKLSADSITREALIRRMKEISDNAYDELATISQIHSSLTIFAPELAVFLGGNDSQFIMALTDWYDCGQGEEGTWNYHTKTSGTDDIIGVWVNMIGATTPDLVKSYLTDDAIGGGLTSRIIFVYENNRYKLCPLPFQTEEELKLKELLYHDLANMHLLRGEFQTSPGFHELWKDWYTNKYPNPGLLSNCKQLSSYCQRRSLHVMKLSMILNASRGNTKLITEVDLSTAIDLLERTERNMPSTFAGIGASPNAKTIHDIMVAIGTVGRIKKKDLHKQFYFDADVTTFEAILDTLQSIHFINIINDSSQGIIIEYVPTSSAVI